MATLSSVVGTIQRNWYRVLRVRLQIEESNELIRTIVQRHLMLHRWLEEQPEHDKESLTKLAVRGWFLGPDVPVSSIPQLGHAVDGTPDEVDIVVGQYIRRRLDVIESALIKSYPDRSHLFKEAFEAHRERRYSLSIRAFLAEADGVFHDRFGKPLFTRKRNDAVSAFMSEVTGRFFQAHLHPLTQVIPLWEDTRRLPDTFEGLNRHQVLHGIKADYDTETNSLKAISLLDYLVWVLNRPADGCFAPPQPPS